MAKKATDLNKDGTTQFTNSDGPVYIFGAIDAIYAHAKGAALLVGGGVVVISETPAVAAAILAGQDQDPAT